MYHYFKEAQAFFFVRLHNLASECNVHFAATTTTAWVLSIVIIWSLIHFMYGKVIDVFLRRMRLPVLYRLRLTDSLWNAGFCIGCVPLCASKLLIHGTQLTDVLNIVTDNIFIAEGVPAHLLFSCVIICAYYVHSVCLTYFQKGTDKEFFTRGLRLLLLYTCYSVRYIRAGLSAVLLIHIYLLNVEFMRICYSLNQSKFVKSGSIRNLTCLLFVIHYSLCGGVFLGTALQSYRLSALNVRVSDDNVSSFVVLHAALWSYISLEIFSAPAMKLIYYCVWLNHSYDHRDWLDYALFPPCNDEIRHLKEIRRKVRLEQAQSLNHYFRKGEKPESETKTSKNSRALYQTVRCVMTLKRRIRRKRAAQSLVFSTSEQRETTDSYGVQSNM